MVVRVDASSSFKTKTGRKMVTIRCSDESGKLSLTFFNQNWREKQLSPGLTIAVFGKPERYRGYLQMTNPIVDLIGDRTGRIVSIYPQSEKANLSTWEIAGWVESALERCKARGIADPVPEAGRIKGRVCFYNEFVDIALDGKTLERPKTAFS